MVRSSLENHGRFSCENPDASRLESTGDYFENVLSDVSAFPCRGQFACIFGQIHAETFCEQHSGNQQSSKCFPCHRANKSL